MVEKVCVVVKQVIDILCCIELLLKEGFVLVEDVDCVRMVQCVVEVDFNVVLLQVQLVVSVVSGVDVLVVQCVVVEVDIVLIKLYLEMVIVCVLFDGWVIFFKIFVG